MVLYLSGREAAVDGVGAVIARASLHTGDPGANGTANEVTGGGYARQNVTVPADTTDDGVLDLAVARFQVTNATITHFVGWNSAGQPVASGPLDSPQAFTTQGDYDLVIRLTSPA